MRAAIITRRDILKSFLSSSIPNLQFHCLAINFQRLYLKIHANRANVIASEFATLYM